jgi:SAM-dependent methyltransferase
LTAGNEPQPHLPTRRFSDRVDYYVRSRPGYPRALTTYLRDRLGLTPERVVADIGSGTGLLTRMLLEMGNHVHAVEPNREMREAAELLLEEHPGFESHDGSAEATGLADHAIDLVVAAQAFHWFDVDLARQEFRRILTPGGQVALIWNRRKDQGTPFLEAYEQMLLRYALDYRTVDHRKTAGPDVLARFFCTDQYGSTCFPNLQPLGWEGLKARLLSSSYTPLAGHPDHEPMMRELRRMFDESERDGLITLEYDTTIHHGRLEDTSGC